MNASHPTLDRYVVPDMPSAEQLAPYLKEIDSNRWYSNFGPLVQRLEQRLGDHLDKHAGYGQGLAITALMTCYDALRIGLQLFRLPPSATVLVPAVTFPACPLAIQHAGGVPLFADVENLSWQLTPKAARRIAEATKIHAVMPVAVYGVPVPVEEWDAFMADTGIPVIIDAAAAFETQKIPKKCLLAHSFHATKPFSVGEGGVLISHDHDQINEARCISNFGTRLRIVVDDGSNAKMSEYHAAVGHAQLDRWEQVKKHRADVFEIYKRALADIKLPVTLQKGVDQIIVSALMLQSHTSSAETIVQALNAENVAAHRMYLPPLYRHPHFSNIPVINDAGQKLDRASPEQKAAHMVTSERMFSSVFGIPFHAFMDAADIHFVLGLLQKVAGQGAHPAS